MNIRQSGGQRLLYSIVAIGVVFFLILSLLLYRVLNDAARSNVTGQTSATAGNISQAIETNITDNVNLVTAVSQLTGLTDLVARTATNAVAQAVEFAGLNLQRANPPVKSFLYYNNKGAFVAGQVVDATYATASQSGAQCDTTDVYCTVTQPPASTFLKSTTFRNALNTALQPGASSSVQLAFDAPDSAYGNLYVIRPIFPAAGGLGSNGSVSNGYNPYQPQGVVVAQIDAGKIFAQYTKQGSVGNLILVGPVVIGPDLTTNFHNHQLPVVTMAGVDPSITGGLKPTVMSFGPQVGGDNPQFTLNGTTVQGSKSPVTMNGLLDVQVLSYAAPGGISASSTRVIIGVLGLFLLLIASIVALFYYLSGRVRRIDEQNALLMRAKSDALTEDIVNVSQALAVAREGDLTVQIPDSESEVGLLSLSLNGLISDYSQIVGGIIRASQAVQEGAARVDEGVRRIVDVATSQSESVAMVAASVEEVASSAVEVQQGTETATTLAANSRQAVDSGQESVSRIGEAVDAIKEAAIGTTREFKRLQEDSIRLTALVASVKANTENLDMQAANATLEARHLGTESGSAFATNIGRLARQAQDTLADAEGAVRSVVTSIDEVNRRIERISEQVRRGVEEVRAVRTTFEQITHTNSSLVQFIDNVADSAGIQARSAQQAAQSITEIAQVFEQFTELLITSGDEIANMRLIVAGLRESVADLKVEETGLLPEAMVGAESAA